MSRLIQLLCRKPVAGFLAVAQVCFVIFVVSQLSLNALLNNAIDLWFDKTDTTLATYEQEKLSFGRNSWIILAINLDQEKRADWLPTVKKLTRFLEGQAQIQQVVSPSNYDVLQQFDGYLEYIPLKPKNDSATEYDRLIAQLGEHPIAGRLVTHAQKKDWVVVLAQEASDISSGGFERQQLVQAIQTHVAEQPAIARFALTGPSVINAELNRLSWGDFITLMPATVVLAGLAVFFFVFGRLRLLLPLLLITGLSSFFTLALMLWLGHPFNMMTISLPGLIFSLGLASGVHLLHRMQLQPGLPADGVAQALYRPMLISHLTTSVGFLSLASIAISPVQVMALFGAAGVMISFVNSLIVFPHLFLAINPKRSDLADWRGFRLTGWVSQGAMQFFTSLDQNRSVRLSVYACLAGVFALIFWGLTHMKFDSTYLNMVAPDEPMKQYYDTLDDIDHYSANVSVLLRNKNPEGLLTQADLNAFQDISKAIEAHPAVLKVVGPANIYDEVAPFFPADQNSDDRVNDIFAFAITGGSSLVDDYIATDFSTFRMHIFFEYMSNNDLKQFLDGFVTGVVDEHLAGPTMLEADLSGLQVLWVNMDQAIYNGQFVSGLIMFLFACLAFGLSIKRVGLTLLAVSINFVPILTILALFGTLNIEIDMATVFILGISLGIAIDDTAYFMHGFLSNLRQMGAAEAVRKALLETGPPIVATTFIILSGFLVLVLSNFVPMQKFGLFVSIGIVAAMLADLIVLPHFVNQLEKRSAS